MKYKENDKRTQKLGQRLQEYRIRARVTQLEIAEAAGLTKNYISAIERGMHKCNAFTLIAYSEKCDVSADILLGIEKEDELPARINRLLAYSDDREKQAIISFIKNYRKNR